MSTSHPAVARAQALFGSGRPREAERALLDALGAEQRELSLLNALASLYLETHRLPECSRVLMRVIEVDPAAVESYHTLAAVLNRLGRDAELKPLYERLVANRPNDALAHFNLACCLRREGDLETALATHERAVALGLDQAEEAWTNIGVIRGELHRDQAARAAFETALFLNPRWIPALYNLALWHEEHGDRTAAVSLFERILALDPDYHAALARLAHGKTIGDPHDPLIERLSLALRKPNLSSEDRENLNFALGKALDDSRRFDEAFAHFSAGNAEARRRAGRYDRTHSERVFAAIRDAFTPEWTQTRAPVSDAPLVFLCGMYRSGSTLLERMLDAHPDFVGGGEIGYFRRTIPREDADWPHTLARAPDDELASLGRGYLDYLDRAFPGALRVVDKQPDNFLLLGLLHAMFPNARFLHTARDARDTALSVYFQQFADSLPWANDLGDIAHYLSLCDALMFHWRPLLGERLLDVRYENLVEDPRRELVRVCEFLGAEWREEMLEFHRRTSRVRTASVWQVREPLNEAAIARWKSYASHLGPLAATLGGTPSP